MKKIAIFALCLVLGAGLLTACGGSSTDETADPSSSATTAPTAATTQPSTAATTPSSSGMLDDGMIDGNGDGAGKSGRIDRMN